MEIIDIVLAGLRSLGDGVVANSSFVVACLLIDAWDAQKVRERKLRRIAVSRLVPAPEMR